MEIRTIELDRVAIGARLREIDADWVAVLAGSMAERGQSQPIEVRAADDAGMFRLIAGGHRVAAAQLLGWPTITATVCDLSDLQATLAEIEENLIRHELTPLDRATFLRQHQEVWQALHPDTKRGARGGRRGSVGQVGQENFFARFDQAIAAKIQASPRDIRRAVFRGAHIADDVRRLIAGHPIARRGTELDALARLVPTEQRLVAEQLLAGHAATVVAALRLVRNAPLIVADPEEAQLQKLQALWRKASARTRRRFLAALAAEGYAVKEAA